MSIQPVYTPGVAELSGVEQDALSRFRPGLEHAGRIFLVTEGAADEGALLAAIASLQSQPADASMDLVVRLGDRQLVFDLKVKGSEVMVGEMPLRQVAAELDLASKLDADPSQLAAARAATDAAWEALAERWRTRTDYQIAAADDYDGGRPWTYVTKRYVEPGLLLGVRRGGLRHFPCFEFSDTGEPSESFARALASLPKRWRQLEKALWFDSPNGWLDQRRPAELLDEAQKEVVTAATRAGRTAF